VTCCVRFFELPTFAEPFFENNICRDLFLKILREQPFFPKINNDPNMNNPSNIVKLYSFTTNYFDSLLSSFIKSIPKESTSSKDIEHYWKLVVSLKIFEKLFSFVTFLSGIDYRSPELMYEATAEIILKKKKEKPKVVKKKGKDLWAKGTGYSTDTDFSNDWDFNAHTKTTIEKTKQQAGVFKSVCAIIDFVLKFGSDLETEGQFIALAQNSCLLPLLFSYLRNDSILDMMKQSHLYIAIFEFLDLAILLPTFYSYLEKSNGSTSSLFDLIDKLNSMFNIALKTKEKAKRLIESYEEDHQYQHANYDDDEIKFAEYIQNIYTKMKNLKKKNPTHKKKNKI